MVTLIFSPEKGKSGPYLAHMDNNAPTRQEYHGKHSKPITQSTSYDHGLQHCTGSRMDAPCLRGDEELRAFRDFEPSLAIVPFVAG